MKALPTQLAGLLVLEPDLHRDPRGYFYERWNARTLADLGIAATFVQDNHSLSQRNVLRGLHYQVERPQGKLVQVMRGEVFDVVVDLRKSSSTFGQWEGIVLSADRPRSLWIPPGFAHGFYVLSAEAEVSYQVTDYWHPAGERSLRWNDPTLAIAWPCTQPPQLSAKDATASWFAEATLFP
ncbi:dTDP-4-dehydrorhamnose 3,5-epimerase [Denitratisoma sp. agr-D3]